VSPPARPTTPVPSQDRILRAWWFVCGWASVAVGSIGVIVPGLPTTVFFVIAAWCFSKSSPRFEQWVLDLPKIGPMVKDHRDGLGMSHRVKRFALGSMWTAIALSAVVLRGRWVSVAAIVALGVLGAAYIVWRVPVREDVLAERALAGRSDEPSSQPP
jgi:uncharacterized membrane protein YbaN (DUF454 family)